MGQSNFHKDMELIRPLQLELDQLIEFSVQNSSSKTSVFKKNFVSNKMNSWINIIVSIDKIMQVYKKYNKRKEALKIVNFIIEVSELSDEASSNFVLLLLMSLQGHLDWIEKIKEGLKQQILDSLQKAIQSKKLQHRLDFWLLNKSYQYMRDLARDEEERRNIDISLCNLMDVAGYTYLRWGISDEAIGWYKEGSIIAQERLGDSHQVNYFLRKLNEIYKKNEDYNMRHITHKNSIIEDLNKVLEKRFDEISEKRFLPSPKEFLMEYAGKSEKFVDILNDQRLTLDYEYIKEYAETNEVGLLRWLKGRYRDVNYNERGEFSYKDVFVRNYILEIQEIIGYLLENWVNTSNFNEEEVLKIVNSRVNDPILNVGILAYFEGNYVTAIHVILPRLESVIKKIAILRGLRTKKMTERSEGEMLLNDYLSPSNEELRIVLGPGLFDLLYWYLVKSDGPFAYRHKVAHGWLSISECNEYLASMLLWFVLKTIRFLTP